MESSTFPTVCIIGAGYSGICAGIKLKNDLGLHDFTIFDENEEVGGTWLVNTYPGCACDIPSHLYSFSFEPNSKWSEVYASQPEILAYMKKVTRKYDLYPNIKFNHFIKQLEWNDKTNKWQVVVLDKSTQSERQLTFDLVITGLGGLRAPNTPEEFLSFKGPRVHSAKWDDRIDLNDLKDKTVAVVGSGASAVQIIPAIVDKVKKLVVYQRHPAWVMPRFQHEFPSWLQWTFESVPGVRLLYRTMLFWSNEIRYPAFETNNSILHKLASKLATSHLNKQIPNDPELREKLKPNYTIGCKRITPSSTYYPALASSNVQVIRSKITEVKEHSILTQDGNETNIDLLILATGFKVQDYFAPLEITGKGPVNVMNLWKREGPSAYLGICSSVSPNLFFVLGPNTGLGHNSIIFMVECQANWLGEVIQEMQRRKSRVVTVKPDAQEAYMDRMLGKMKSTVWGSNDCGSWYADHRGIITALTPYSLVSYWRQTRKPDFSHLNFQ